MYAVGLGRGARWPNPDAAALERLRPPAAAAPSSPATSQLSDAFREVVDELSHQYVLSYAPTNDKLDGTWRALTVEVPGQ